MIRCCRLGMVLVVLALFGSAVPTAAAGDPAKALKYQFKPGETYIYAVTIVAEAPDVTETSQGTIQLVVKAVDATGMQLTPTVNLPKQVKAKAAPGFKGRPGARPPTPRDRRVSSARELTVDPYGKVIKSSGETPLPYLLGPAAQLVIEPLSPKGEQRWGSERDLVIREVRRAFAFGPRAATNETNTSAKEVVAYEIAGSAGSTVHIKKTCDLSTTAQDGGAARIQFQGTSDLAFDSQAGLMKSCEFKGAVVLSEKNVTLRIPLTVSYRLMDAAEAAAAKKDQEERRAKALAAIKEANALKPVSEAEITQALADLKSTNRLTVFQAADRLAKAIPIESRHDEVAAALAAAMNDASTRFHATKALKVWGTDKAVVPLLKHQDWVVRMEACRVLAEVGTRESVAALTAAQSDSNRLVAMEAGKAIKTVETRNKAQP